MGDGARVVTGVDVRVVGDEEVSTVSYQGRVLAESRWAGGIRSAKGCGSAATSVMRAVRRGKPPARPGPKPTPPNPSASAMLRTRVFEDRLYCNNLQFDVGNGSVLKFGVATKFGNFISDVITWGVNLNKVDETDERTLLDYVRWQMEENQGNPIAERMRLYYRALRKAGAKHRSEL